MRYLKIDHNYARYLVLADLSGICVRSETSGICVEEVDARWQVL